MYKLYNSIVAWSNSNTDNWGLGHIQRFINAQLRWTYWESFKKIKNINLSMCNKSMTAILAIVTSVSCHSLSPHNAVSVTLYDLFIFIVVNSSADTLSHTWDSWICKGTSPCLLELTTIFCSSKFVKAKDEYLIIPCLVLKKKPSTWTYVKFV